jgi:excisionase family DNA binding protein
MDSKWVTPEQFAEEFNTTDRHIRDMVREGRLPAIRLGRRIRIDRAAAEERLLKSMSGQQD